MILQWMTLTPHSSCQAWWAEWIFKRVYELERILVGEIWEKFEVKNGRFDQDTLFTYIKP